jgi:DNA-binding NarL/FixJ family response regulator
MVNGISSNAADPIQSTQATTAGQSTAKTATPEDSVKLSPTAQARLMLHQGMSVTQIASDLGLSVQAVSSSLGLTTTSSAAPVAVPQSSSAKT